MCCCSTAGSSLRTGLPLGHGTNMLSAQSLPDILGTVFGAVSLSATAAFEDNRSLHSSEGTREAATSWK